MLNHKNTQLEIQRPEEAAGDAVNVFEYKKIHNYMIGPPTSAYSDAF